MKRVKKKIVAASQKKGAPRARVVPLVVPHGGAEAGRDYESAFDLLQRDGRVHELWRREPPKSRLARASQWMAREELILRHSVYQHSPRRSARVGPFSDWLGQGACNASGDAFSGLLGSRFGTNESKGRIFP